MRPLSILAPCFLLLATTVARADFLVGQVVDANGAGVPFADLDVEAISGGGDPNITNDGTDAFGNFNVTVPAGVWRVVVKPPAPPVTTHLIRVIEPVSVVGTTNLGQVFLEPGIALSGRCVNAAGLGVANVDIDVRDEVLGETFDPLNDSTDTFGNFNVAVPANAIELRLDATPVIGQTLASQAIELSPTGNLSLGDVLLPTGFAVSGRVQRSNGLGVSNVDIDVSDSATGEKLYTPGDNSDGLGNFSVVVPAGTWSVLACPDTATLLAPAELENVVVAGPLALGNLTLLAGFAMFGTITEAGGGIHPGADVDLFDAVTGASVPTCNDDANGAGQYSIVVPPGSYVVRFTPSSFDVPFGVDVQSVTISGATLLNGVLPACPFASNYGTGLAGSGGLIPTSVALGGAPSASNGGFAVGVTNALGGSVSIGLANLSATSFPLFGGTLLVNPGGPAVFLTVPLAGTPGVAGAGAGAVVLGDLSAVVGQTGYVQFGVFDPGAPANWALSNGLSFVVCP